jgi:hypothetical protein
VRRGLPARMHPGRRVRSDDLLSSRPDVRSDPDLPQRVDRDRLVRQHHAAVRRLHRLRHHDLMRVSARMHVTRCRSARTDTSTSARHARPIWSVTKRRCVARRSVHARRTGLPRGADVPGRVRRDRRVPAGRIVPDALPVRHHDQLHRRLNLTCIREPDDALAQRRGRHCFLEGTAAAMRGARSIALEKCGIAFVVAICPAPAASSAAWASPTKMPCTPTQIGGFVPNRVR